MTDKKYRPNVAAVILSPKYPYESKIFLGSRIDYKGSIWQFPQGGIDEGESPQDALFRELKEEIGTDDIEIIDEYPQWLSYDFPNIIASKMYPYDGQTQKYFLVKLKSTAKINLETIEPEFKSYKFVDSDKVIQNIGNMKKRIYKKVLAYFKKSGYL